MLFNIVLGCNEGMTQDIKACCSISNPCFEGQGDCDDDSECLGNLVCGSENCDNSKFPSISTDCCESVPPPGR